MIIFFGGVKAELRLPCEIGNLEVGADGYGEVVEDVEQPMDVLDVGELHQVPGKIGISVKSEDLRLSLRGGFPHHLGE